jgi:RNA polymerase sigma-70 factor (sigma-E family)
MRHQDVEQAAFVDFYEGHRTRCLRAVIAHGLSRTEAEDAVAEAFARAWASWAKVATLQSPAAWVVRTALNTNISWWRKRRRELPALVGHDEPEQAPPGERVDDMDLVRAIAELAPRQREVVVLRYLLDLDTDTTARTLGIAPGTVKSHLHHALAALRERLGQDQEALR